jgi:hypothetical protein
LPDLYRANLSTEEIKRRFDADGGPPVPAKALINVWAAELGAKRPAKGEQSAEDAEGVRVTRIPSPAPETSPAVEGVRVTRTPSAPALPADEGVFMTKTPSPATAPTPAFEAPGSPFPKGTTIADLSRGVDEGPAGKPGPDRRRWGARNGVLNVAARQEADLTATQEACSIAWPDALEWANRHRPDGFNRPKSLADVNAIRAHHCLPRYRIIRPNAPLDKLPAAHLIDQSDSPGRAAHG